MFVITKPVLSSMAKAMKSSLYDVGVELSYQKILDLLISLTETGNSHKVLQRLKTEPVFIVIPEVTLRTVFGSELFGSSGVINVQTAVMATTAQICRLMPLLKTFDNPVDVEYSLLESDAGVSFIPNGRTRSAILSSCLMIAGHSFYPVGYLPSGEWIVEKRSEIPEVGCLFSLLSVCEKLSEYDLSRADIITVMKNFLTPLVYGEKNGMYPQISGMLLERISKNDCVVLCDAYGITSGTAFSMAEEFAVTEGMVREDPSGEYRSITPEILVSEYSGFRYSGVIMKDIREWNIRHYETKVFIYRMIGDMLNNGMPLPTVLKYISSEDSMFMNKPGGATALKIMKSFSEMVSEGNSLGECARMMFPPVESLIIMASDRSGTLGKGLQYCRSLAAAEGTDEQGLRALFLSCVASLINAGVQIPEIFRMLSLCDWSYYGDTSGYVNSCAAAALPDIMQGNDMGTALKDVYPPEEWLMFGPFSQFEAFDESIIFAARKLTENLGYNLYEKKLKWQFN